MPRDTAETLAWKSLLFIALRNMNILLNKEVVRISGSASRTLAATSTIGTIKLAWITQSGLQGNQAMEVLKVASTCGQVEVKTGTIYLVTLPWLSLAEIGGQPQNVKRPYKTQRLNVNASLETIPKKTCELTHLLGMDRTLEIHTKFQ